MTIRYSPSYTPVSVLLACKHTQDFAPAPKIGDELYCRRCANYTLVIAETVDWQAKCQDCPMGRHYGADEEKTRRVALKHARKFAHVVAVRERGGAVPDLVGHDQTSGNNLITMLEERGLNLS